MSLVLSKGYTWKEGESQTARKLNILDTIADGQAGVFSNVTSSAFTATTTAGTSTGITTTITTGSLVGKTITVTNGIITGFA